jgi:glycosyltransferase involved in cell wall biosynthesis
MSGRELVSIGKIVYRYPLSWEEQDFRTYAALADAAGLRSIRILAKSPDSKWHHASQGSIDVTLVPLRLPAPLDVLEFAAMAGFAARRRLAADAVVQCSEPLGSGLAVLLATARKRVPTVAHLQGELLDLPGSVGRLRSRMMGALARHVLRRMDAVRCISRPALEQAAGIGVDRARLHLVPPRCDTARFDPQRFESATPKSSEEQVIVFVGSLTIHKGIGFLLHAVATLHGQKRVRCVLYGDGPERAALEALAKRLDIGGVVEFAGRIDHDRVPEAMFAADVMALPSLNEGTPRVVLEAMALGLPVVATSVGGIPDVLVPDAGVLVPPGDAPALARALASILDDPAARARCQALRQAVVEEYSFDAGIQRYSDLLRRASESR